MQVQVSSSEYSLVRLICCNSSIRGTKLLHEANLPIVIATTVPEAGHHQEKFFAHLEHRIIAA
jgi:hypothetical protein